MMELKLEEIIRATRGRLLNGDKNSTVNKISTDTRTILEGDFFIPLKGGNFDGHEYIEMAAKKGAKGFLTEKNIKIKDINTIKVRDTNKAFLDISSYYRKKFKIPYIAITGSVGKTTTKDMVYMVLSKKYKTLKTQGNFNNEVGLPKTLLNLKPEHEMAVIELGMNNFGEISRLSKTVKPDISIITNIGLSHIGNFKSKSDILKAKLEILDGMNRKGTLVLCGDDSLLSGLRGLIKQKTVYYGIEEDMDYQATRIISNGKNKVEFDVRIRNTDYTFNLNVPGIHNVKNALAAIAIGDINGVEPADMMEVLRDYRSSKMRLVFKEFDGTSVIDDTYNASPDSVKAAVDVLYDTHTEGRKIAVIGDMLELGDYSGDAHYETGKYVSEKEIDKLFCYGEYADYILNGALEKGMAKKDVFSYNDMDKLIEKLKDTIKRKDLVLIKGSRGKKMENIIGAIWGEN
jgi:UDP-N-acetylmuramoyl-tripeptide--D-alanyl-D-alanine ligase